MQVTTQGDNFILILSRSEMLNLSSAVHKAVESAYPNQPAYAVFRKELKKLQKFLDQVIKQHERS